MLLIEREQHELSFLSIALVCRIKCEAQVLTKEFTYALD
jgi:hypothetical protein